MGTEQACRLYLITPDRFDPDPFRVQLENALSGGDVACLQLRLKDVDDDSVRRATEHLMPVCHAHDVAFLINDRPDLAAELEADGVHVGQQDENQKAARAKVGDERIVGVTCHDSRHLAMEAAEKNADYVAFGAAFPTATKATQFRAGPELFNWWSELFEVPCVAIGGLTADNCSEFVSAGADFIAVCSNVWGHPQGPGTAVGNLNEAILKALPND
ncbi:MAG TPA: thiamine phosphate synthase [Sneathiellales bacterium]|nr:thiamine phosphate synthase [Sneathiellales bacterium]